MKLTHELTIARSRDAVWNAFDNPDNLRKWQPTLRAFEHQGGTRGQPGAISVLTYEENGKPIVMTETVTVRREPEEFAGTYDNAMAINIIRNTFTALDAGRTRWAMESEFLFKTFLYRVLAPLIRGLVDRRIKTDMERFKQLMENGAI